MCKQWDLLNENSTMSHWKYIPFSIYSIYRILPCKQWDLNPHSFTLLFPKNSLSTNFNMLTLLYTKIHYPKNPIRVTPIFLPFYYFPFNPFHHSKIHYPINILYYPTKPTLLLTTQKKTTLIFIFILHYTY